MNTLRRLVPVGRARGALHNLRILTTAVLFVAFVVFAIGQWLSARWLYDGGFGEAEHRDALAQARHAQAIVQYPLNFLKRTAIDNAMWDEAYRYMQGRNFKHPDNLLAMTDSFRMMRLSAYAFAALDGKVVYARQFDSRRSGLTEPERNVRAALEPLGTIGRHIRRGETSSGYTHIGNRVFGWCSAPVLHSDGTGPTDGSWILVSELDSGFLDATSQALGSQAVLQVRPLPPARSAAPSAPLAADDVQITLLDDAFLDARFSLGTIDEDSELDLVVTIPRSVHATALRSSRYLLWSTLLFGTLLSALALWFIQWRLLRPVEAASRDLVRIGRTGDLSARLAEARQDDEIGLLVHAANHMLAQLERKRTSRRPCSVPFPTRCCASMRPESFWRRAPPMPDDTLVARTGRPRARCLPAATRATRRIACSVRCSRRAEPVPISMSSIRWARVRNTRTFTRRASR